jgi:hypothetical protein
MKTKHLFILILSLVIAGSLAAPARVKASKTKMITQTPKMKMTTPIPENLTTPDKVKTSIGTLEFFDGVPIGNTKEMLHDFVDRGRAVEAFINMTPAASLYSLRQGHRDLGLTESNQILLAEQLGDSKPLVLTWNNTSLYTWGFLDLKKDGPTVIEIPPDVLGILDDMYFRYISDMGAAGPDRGKGGKYLVLPPGYEGDVPDGYYVVNSKTYAVWNFMRGYVRGNVQDPANIKRAADNIKKNLKVYPLAKKGNPPKMEFKNMSGLAGYNTIMPNDFSFFEVVNKIVQEEADGWLDPELLGQLRAIGIAKGQPFNPDARMRKILTDAAAIGNAYARVNTVYPKDPGNYIYKDKHTEWVMAYPDKDTYFLENGARRMDGRLWMHYNAVCVTPAMALTRPGAGSDYMITGLDSAGRTLDGAKTYKLHLPPNFPVKDNWSVTIYDPQTRSMLQTDQQFAGINSLSADQKKNADGSIDVIFAPKTPKGMEKNWIQTIPGKSWFILLRAYGPLKPWIDKTWRPSELELVE